MKPSRVTIIAHDLTNIVYAQCGGLQRSRMVDAGIYAPAEYESVKGLRVKIVTNDLTTVIYTRT